MVGGLIDVHTCTCVCMYVCTIHMANMGPCLRQQSRAPSATASILSHSFTFSFIMLTQHERRAIAFSDVQSERLTKGNIIFSELGWLMHDTCHNRLDVCHRYRNQMTQTRGESEICLMCNEATVFLH